MTRSPRPTRPGPWRLVSGLSVAMGVAFAVLLMSISYGVSDRITADLDVPQLRDAGFLDVGLIESILTALTVAVTSFEKSPLAEAADVVLPTAVHETTFRLAALSALHSQLVALDLIYVAVAQRTYDRTTEAFEVTARAVRAHRLHDEPLSHLARRKAH